MHLQQPGDQREISEKSFVIKWWNKSLQSNFLRIHHRTRGGAYGPDQGHCKLACFLYNWGIVEVLVILGHSYSECKRLTPALPPKKNHFSGTPQLPKHSHTLRKIFTTIPILRHHDPQSYLLWMPPKLSLALFSLCSLEKRCTKWLSLLRTCSLQSETMTFATAGSVGMASPLYQPQKPWYLRSAKELNSYQPCWA